MYDHLLSCLIFLPLAAALALLFIPREKKTVFRFSLVTVTALELLLAVILACRFEPAASSLPLSDPQRYQFTEQMPWIALDLGSPGRLSIQYYLGVDGLSLSLVLLSAIVLLIGAISSLGIAQMQKGYALLYLLLGSAIMGAFTALDFFLFFLFFEFMLLPMYFLIGLWGGPGRNYASIKFFLYTLLGSVLILIAMIALSVSFTDPAQPGFEHTFSLTAMTGAANLIPGSLLDPAAGAAIMGLSARHFVFLLLLLGFAVKLPAVPFHTWLPDAHVEAPTPVSVVLAAILLKIGAYGLIRIAFPIFPDSALHYAWWIGLAGLLAILYGALNALAMRDLKKLIAYSSVSHMGFVLLGLASLTVEGTSGAVYQLFSHGLISSALFLVAGVIYDRTGDRQLDSYSGLAAVMPYFAGFTTLAFFASVGLPGFSGFIAELLVLVGAFRSAGSNGLLPQWFALTALLGLLLGAAYYLWALQRMFFGKLWLKEPAWTAQLPDISKREWLMIGPLLLGALLLGIFPQLLLGIINPGMQDFTTFVLTEGKRLLAR